MIILNFEGINYEFRRILERIGSKVYLVEEIEEKAKKFLKLWSPFLKRFGIIYMVLKAIQCV